MPQSLAQWLSGYVSLTAAAVTHRLFDEAPPHAHPLFPAALPAAAAPLLADRTCVVTGADDGPGYATARHLAALGATVILACRSPLRAAAAAHAIRAAHIGARVEACALDPGSYISARAFADMLTGRRVDALVLHGGVCGAARAEPETHLVENHVAHALLALLLLPCLSRAADARVVFVAGDAARVSDLRTDDLSFARRPYCAATAHANSMLCMLLFMRALAKRVRGSCVRASAVLPGRGAHACVFAAAAAEADACGAVLGRACRAVELPAHLVGDGDGEVVWEVTLEMAGVTGADLSGLRALEKKGAAVRDAAWLSAATQARPRGK